MGAVYKAEATKLKRPVALKFPAAHLLKDEEARKHFYCEAQAAAALHLSRLRNRRGGRPDVSSDGLH